MTSDIRTRYPSTPDDETPAHRRARFNVYAAFDDHTPAQHALEALGRAGIEGANTSLRGPTDPETPAETAAADARVMKHWFGNVIVFAAIGAVVGFAAGIPLAAIVLEEFLPQDTSALNIFVGALLTALGISAIFGLVAMIWPVGSSHAWEQSFYDEHGNRVVLGVHLDDREHAEQALEVLNDAGAVDTYVSGIRDRSAETAHETAS